MSRRTSHEVRLASRPAGIPAATTFTLVRTELEPLRDRETIARGIDHAVDAFIGLLQGRDIGKTVVQLA